MRKSTLPDVGSDPHGDEDRCSEVGLRGSNAQQLFPGHGQRTHDEERLGRLPGIGVNATNRPNRLQIDYPVSRGPVEEAKMTYDVELGDENEDDEDESEPGADHAAESEEGELLKRVALLDPSAPEADAGEKRRSSVSSLSEEDHSDVLAQANRSPGEESGQARKSEEPVKDDASLRKDVDAGKGNSYQWVNFARGEGECDVLGERTPSENEEH